MVTYRYIIVANLVASSNQNWHYKALAI